MAGNLAHMGARVVHNRRVCGRIFCLVVTFLEWACPSGKGALRVVAACSGSADEQ